MMKKILLLICLLMSISSIYAETVYYYTKVTTSDGTVSWLKIETVWNSKYSRYDTFHGDWTQRDIKGELDLDEVYTGPGGTGTKKTINEIGSGAFFGFSGLTSVKGSSIKTLKNQAFQDCTSLTNINFPNLESMDDNAFAYCTSLVSYTIPESARAIDGSAFMGCTNLTNLTVNSNNYYFSCEDNILYSKNKTGIYAFLSCRKDTTFMVPPSIKTIGSRAFYYNKSLKSVVISNGVETINQSAFGGTNIQSVYIPQSVTKIMSGAFSSCVSLTRIKVDNPTPISLNNAIFPTNKPTLYVPQGSKKAYEAANYWKDAAEIIEYSPSPAIQFADAAVKSICVANWDYDGDGELSLEEAQEIREIGTQFQNNKVITSFNELQYFTNLKHIAASAFSGCTNLASFKFPENLTTIGYNAFLNTAWLNAQPNGLLYIGKVLYAYRGTMPANTKIIVKDGTVSICDHAFYYQTGLVDIELPSSLISIGSEAEGNVFSGCTGLTDIKIPEGVKSIVRYAFYNSGLKTVELPKGLESIGNSSFRSCTSLESFVIPNKVRTIGKNTFRSCTNLKSVTMPYYLKTVATDAFRDCSQLQAVYVPDLEKWIQISFEDYRANPLTYAHHLYLGNEEITDLVIPMASSYGSSGSVIQYYPSAINPLAFYGCSNIKTVSIPKSISSIGSNAFAACTALTAVIVETTPFELNSNAFPTKSNITLYTSKYYLSQYQTANVWSTFKIIKSYPDADVNCDKNVDVVDVIDIVRYTRGSASSSFDKLLADLNSDKEIDLSDAKQVLNSVSYSKILTTILPESGEQLNTVKVGNFEVRARQTCVADIILENTSNQLVGFQMDVTLPEGLSLNSNLCRLSNRIADEEQKLIVGNLGNNTYRFTSTSLSLHPITGNNGKLITLSLDAKNMTASDNITVSNIRFVTDNSERIVMPDAEFEVQPIEYVQFVGGDGTEENPYLILDPNDFINLANDVNGGTSYEGVFFKVAKPEIDFDGVSYTAIGKTEYISNKEVISAFSGIFDGNNVTLKNLSTNKGLFGYIGKNGLVKGIITDETCVITGTGNTAGIAGVNKGTISDCVNKASVTSSNYHIAGICGDNMGTIMNCKNYGTITGVKNGNNTDIGSMIGGIAGDLDGGEIINCENYGAVSSTGFQIGGIVGLVTDRTCSIENCVNKGDVTGLFRVGGIIGNIGTINSRHTIKNNLVSECTITATDRTSEVGAISDRMSTSATTNFYTPDVLVKAESTIYEGLTPRGVWGDYDPSTNSYVLKDITENWAAMLLQKDNEMDYLTLADTEGFIGGQITLNVGMTNTDFITALQFEVSLPTGMTISKCQLTDRKGEDHTATFKKLDNENYQIVVTSLSKDNLSGTEGALVNLTLCVDEYMSTGDYPINITNIYLTTVDALAVNPKNATATLTVSNIKIGDVNGDGSINVTDVGMVIDDILENTPANFSKAAADVNGDNVVNVTDVGLIIDIILSDGASAKERGDMENALDPQ